jgi:hypothetical protein
MIGCIAHPKIVSMIPKAHRIDGPATGENAAHINAIRTTPKNRKVTRRASHAIRIRSTVSKALSCAGVRDSLGSFIESIEGTLFQGLRGKVRIFQVTFLVLNPAVYCGRQFIFIAG